MGNFGEEYRGGFLGVLWCEGCGGTRRAPMSAGPRAQIRQWAVTVGLQCRGARLVSDISYFF